MIKYKINLEKLDYDNLNLHDKKLIEKYKNLTLELVSYEPSDNYPYELKLGDKTISFKEEEIIEINLKNMF